MATKQTVLDVPLIIKKEKKGYSVECIDLNIVTQGETLKEAKKNAIEAITLHLESARELGILNAEFEKLGVIKKKGKLELLPRELDSAPITFPFPAMS